MRDLIQDDCNRELRLGAELGSGLNVLGTSGVHSCAAGNVGACVRACVRAWRVRGACVRVSQRQAPGMVEAEDPGAWWA